MPNRLRTLDGSLCDQIEALDESRQRQLARDVAFETAEALGVNTLPAVSAALRRLDGRDYAGDSQALDVLVQHMDEVAWDFDERGEADQYLAAFSQARACNSVLAALDQNAAEAALNAVYESHAATGTFEISNRILTH